jgi:PAS domain S-box-containing protein
MSESLASSGRPLILCIDDDQVVLRIRKLLVTGAGYDVLTASSGESGLDLFRSTAVDLVVADHFLSDSKGTEIARQMKALKPEVPILIASGGSDNPSGLQFADGFVSKGEPPDVLLAAIAGLLKHQSPTTHPSKGTVAPDFRLLFESVPGLYLVLAADLTIVAVSDAYLRVTMTNRDQILGRGIFDVFPDNPDDPSADGVRNLSASLNRVLRTRSIDAMPVQRYDIQRPQSEGGGFEERYWSPVNSPVPDSQGQIAYIIHRVEDVTEFVRLRQSESEQLRLTEELRTRADKMESEIYLRARQLDDANRQLRNANEELSRLDRHKDRQLWEYRNRLALIVDCSTDAIIGKDLDGIITSWNKGAERIYGYAPEEVLGQPITILAPPDRHDEIREILAGIRDGKEIDHIDTTRVAKDGRSLDVSISVSPIRDSNGAIIGASTIARDISAQRRAEDQLRQSQKMEAVGQLAGGVAHDFNNILGIITSCAELLRAQVGDDPLRLELIGHIRDAGFRGASVTRQLLAFSRKQPLKTNVMDLNQRLRDVCKLLLPLLGDDVEISFVPRSDTALIEADPSQVDQIVLNLAVNARDAMPRGGKFVLETSTVFFNEELVRQHPQMKTGNYVLLAISDTGCGMSQATASRIFEPFFTTKEVGKGTGLGLSTVYGIVQQSNGHIWVYSEPGHGTTFRIYLPCMDERVGIAPPPDDNACFQRGDGKTVLLVEDNEVIRRVIRQMLQDQGYAVVEAENGREGLLQAASQAGRLDLVLTDVVMPGLSGPELVSQLRNSHPELNVLYMSGYASEFVLERGLHIGGTVLEKPFTRAALFSAIEAVSPSVKNPTEH